MPNNPTIINNINQCQFYNTSIKSPIFYGDSFDTDYEEEYDEYICDFEDMKCRVDSREFSDNNPIYLLDIDSIDWEIGIEDLIEEDMDIVDSVTMCTYYGFEEDQFLVVVNAYYRDVGEQPWSVDDIIDYLTEQYDLEPLY